MTFKFRTCVFFVISLAAVLLFYVESKLLTVQVDDAYITFQYSQNLADGLGAVFNPEERVEGYSNLLWMLIIAGGIFCGWSAEGFTHYLSLCSGIGLFAASGWYSWTLLPTSRRHFAFLAPLLVYASNPFITWAFAGLETTMFSALIVAALAAHNAGYLKWSILFGVLTMLSRPDGVLLPAALVLATVISAHRRDRSALSPQLFAEAIIYFLTLLGLTLFRIAYYGDYVPNTFHVKVGIVPWSAGFDYIRVFLADGAGFLVPPFIIAAVYCRALISGVVFAALLLVYVVYVGGDGFYNSRFLLPLVPVLVAGSLYCIADLLQKRTVMSTILASACVILMPIWSVMAPKGTLMWNDIRKDIGAKRTLAYPKAQVPEPLTRDIIAAIKNIQPEVKLIAALGIGQLRFWSGIPVLDLLGLTDRTIAETPAPVSEDLIVGHAKSNADYVIARQPGVILIPRKNTPVFFLLPAIKDLWQHPELERQYRWDDGVHGYVRKDQEFSSAPKANAT